MQTMATLLAHRHQPDMCTKRMHAMVATITQAHATPWQPHVLHASLWGASICCCRTGTQEDCKEAQAPARWLIYDNRSALPLPKPEPVAELGKLRHKRSCMRPYRAANSAISREQLSIKSTLTSRLPQG